jgi:hypothetical protein
MFEVRITAQNEYIKVYQDCYFDENRLNELSDTIMKYVSNFDTDYYFSLGKKKIRCEKFFMFHLCPADYRGHVIIELDMAIGCDDCLEHRCRFNVESELGLVESFGKQLKDLLQGKDGTSVELN